ncbi:DUF2306 domain-containing protein [Halomonas janggokensis]|uniref:DUF2306 domain-containing protein n=1 Tax=unclassified Halomonas TaxID=2609666 RepID=UPI000A280A71|nr:MULTISPECIES: DUF2306 domain-containing protein [unclassified Halomonas]MDR5886352.1 DUF2306 domain-containing protein [Halomonas janggokensis]QPL47066.1 DUF2306 domain-containing protein [Halomonas sp. A40-4]
MLTLHLWASFTGLGVGVIVLLRHKGDWLHKTLGIAWVSAMVASALSSFWLGGGVFPMIGHWGPIHLLSLWMLVAISLALLAILQGRVRDHKRWMLGAYVGLLGAFIGTLMPGRWVSAQLGIW